MTHGFLLCCVALCLCLEFGHSPAQALAKTSFGQPRREAQGLFAFLPL